MFNQISWLTEINDEQKLEPYGHKFIKSPIGRGGKWIIPDEHMKEFKFHCDYGTNSLVLIELTRKIILRAPILD